MHVSRIAGWGLAVVALLGLAACGPDTPERKAKARASEYAAARAAYDEALAEARASRGEGQPAMWTLSDEDTTIRILGTVHLLRPDLDWQTDEIRQSLAEADTLVFELDTADPQAMFYISDAGMMKDGKQLTSLLDEIEQQELQAALDHVDLPLGAIQSMRPWWAAFSLSVFQMQKQGFDPTAGVEQVLMAEAQRMGKKFEYLETPAEQLGYLAGLPDDIQVDFLLSTAMSITEDENDLDTLVAEWADGDVHGLGVLMANPEMMGSEEVYDALLRRRNEAWVDKIEAMLDEPGTRLIAVGAGHLAGPDSVIALLEAEGHEVSGP